MQKTTLKPDVVQKQLAAGTAAETQIQGLRGVHTHGKEWWELYSEFLSIQFITRSWVESAMGTPVLQKNEPESDLQLYTHKQSGLN